MIAFRVLQGAFAAMLFPAALAIVVAAFPLRERGRALAVFFGITGGLTAVGPLAGGYLTEWTWRAIFWINMPVAIIALVLTAKAKPEQARRNVPIDYRGAVLVSAAMGLRRARAAAGRDVGLDERADDRLHRRRAAPARRVRRVRAAPGRRR